MVDKDSDYDYNLLSLPRNQLLNIIQKQRGIIKRSHEIVEYLKSTRTEEIEEGTYIRRKIRHGEKRKQKTNRLRKNPEKVILTYLGDIEFFCYPYHNDETVYARIGKSITGIDKYESQKLLHCYNRIKWALNGGIKASVKGESKSKKAKEIHDAYKYAEKKVFEEMKKKSNERNRTQELAEKLQKKYKSKMPICECGERASLFYGMMGSIPVRICTRCGNAYNEFTKELMFNDLDYVLDWKKEKKMRNLNFRDENDKI